MTDREEFLQIFRQHVTRPGSEKLLDWLDHKTDFFSAPASTRFHGACTGGLCMHSPIFAFCAVAPVNTPRTISRDKTILFIRYIRFIIFNTISSL